MARIHDRILTSAQSTNATPITLATVAVPDNSSIYIKAVITARNASSGDSASFDFDGGAKRHNGGNAVALGSSSLMGAKDAALTTTSISIAVSGTNALVQATGVALTTLDWRGYVEYYYDV